MDKEEPPYRAGKSCNPTSQDSLLCQLGLMHTDEGLRRRGPARRQRRTGKARCPSSFSPPCTRGSSGVPL